MAGNSIEIRSKDLNRYLKVKIQMVNKHISLISLVWYKLVQLLWKTVWHGLLKLKIHSWPIPAPRNVLHGDKCTCVPGDTYKKVHAICITRRL